jgi:hypothetical protein
LEDVGLYWGGILVVYWCWVMGCYDNMIKIKDGYVDVA